MFIQELREKAGIEKVLSSVFVTPFQRITRYPLLLREMVKIAKKSEDEIDISLIKDVFDRTGEITEYVNKVKEAGAIKKLPVRYHHSISFLA